MTPKIPELINDYGYDVTPLPQHSEYIKRLIIKLHEPIGRNVYLRRYESVQEQLAPKVYELAPDTKLGTFPGYQNVRLRHHELQRIISNDERGDTHIVGHFQYTILEIFDPKTRPDVILRRESFWKQALDTRLHGMNRN